MSYKDKFEQSDKKALNSLIATKILDLMDKLRLNPNKNAQRRWVWELLQNAKDVAIDNQKVEIELFIQDKIGQQSVLFSHNGKPFTVDNITFLIKQVSTKERNVNAANEKPKTTGKFGTGFLTTHLLSEKVAVSGVVKEPDLDYRNFVLPLDRSGRTQDEIIESVNKSIAVRDTLDSQMALSNYSSNAFNTTFYYNLDENGYKVAKVGVEDLHVSLPYTLAFLPIIKSVNIKHENTIYELSKIEQESKEITISTILKKTKETSCEIKIVTLSKNNTTIAVEIEKSNNKTYVKGFSDNLPKLFCDFPLIGTNDFNLPIVINSSNFNPTEPRDGVHLTDVQNDKITENKNIFLEGIELYFLLLQYASENNWQNLYHLAKTDTPKAKEWFSTSWFETIQKIIRQKLLITPIVDTNTGNRVSIITDGEEKPNVWFPYSANADVREKIWDLMSIWIPEKLPKKKDVHDWYNVVWNDVKLTLKVVTATVELKGSIKELSAILNCDETSAIAWLNDFYDLLNFEGKFIQEVIDGKRAIIPNQNGKFRKSSELKIDQSIEEELKNVIHILGIDVREYLLHEDIQTTSKYKDGNEGQILYYIKKQEEIIDEINKILKEGQNEKISQACDYLIACFADASDFPNEQQKIYDFCKMIWDIPEKKFLKLWNSNIWKEVNVLQIGWLVHEIAENKTVEKFQETLKADKSYTLNWLNSFVEFLIENVYDNYLSVKDTPILPNQNGIFCTKDDLFLDNGEIDEELKDILENLGYEIREELLDINIFLDLPKNRERTQKFVADEISSAVGERLKDLSRTEETKKIFKELYLWLNKNKSLAKTLFSNLYTNKHRLYDDDEVAANMQKAEMFDEILKKANIDFKNIESNKETVTHILSKINDYAKISQDDAAGLSENRDAYILQEAEKIKQQRNEIKDLDDLVATGVTIATVNEVSSMLNFGSTNFSSSNWEYVMEIISRAVRRVLEHLRNDSRYEFSDELGVLMVSTQTPTVITGVFKNKQPINLVIRPSDGRKVHVYYGAEFEALLLEDTEFWIDNGRDTPELLTIGKILQYTETEIIPLHPKRLK